MELDILRYIQENIPELRGRLFPVFTDDISQLSIAYQFADISAGHLSRTQLTLNVIHDDYDMCMEIHGKLKRILAMEEDADFLICGNTRFRSVLSAGGGTLFNNEISIWEVTKYYQIDWRNIKHE